MTWVERGEHQVLVFLDGFPITGSPFTIVVTSAVVRSQDCTTAGLDEALAVLSTHGELPHQNQHRLLVLAC